MSKCDKVNLYKLQAKYLNYIVETHAELNILEHIEKCETCRETIKQAITTDAPLPDYGNLFQKTHEDQTVPQHTDYKNTPNFIDARTQWRKRRLKELLNDAEAELEDLNTRLA